MRGFFWFIGRVISLGFLLGVIGVTSVAIAAVLGFVHPMLDVFNHFQVLIFAGSLLFLLTVPFVVRPPRWRALGTALAATGFLASALIVVPDIAQQMLPRDALPDDGRTVYKLMTHNLFGKNYEPDRVLAAIKAEDPDILTFQEYFPEQRNGLHDKLIADYPYFRICIGGKRQNIAVYAQIPFKAETSSGCSDQNVSRIAQIIAQFDGRDGVPFTVVTTHLDWPIQISTFDDGANIVENIDLMFARQRGEFAEVSDALTNLPGPLLLAGDFNSTSWSYTLRDFAAENRLARQDFAVLTYPMRFRIDKWRDTWPLAPLDHVMTRGDVSVHDLYAGDPAGSDHRPLITQFSISR